MAHPSNMLGEELLNYPNLSMREWYRTVYLKSDHWLALREEAKNVHGSSCEKCGSTFRIDVHHLNYREIYDVHVDDLQILCRACHEVEHNKVKWTLGIKPRLRVKRRVLCLNRYYADMLPRTIRSVSEEALRTSPLSSSKGKINWAVNFAKHYAIQNGLYHGKIEKILACLKSGKLGRAARAKYGL